MSQYRDFLEAIAACIDSAPVVSIHNEPQVSPQEWDCGCITATYITDRDFLRNERPFEMRLVKACLGDECGTLPWLADLAVKP